MRCSTCGVAPRPWYPHSVGAAANARRTTAHPRCKEVEGFEFEMARLGRRPETAAGEEGGGNAKRDCISFRDFGVCRSTEKNGWCNFRHVRRNPILREVVEPLKQRCGVCTLPLPCTKHFPLLGERLSLEDQEIMQPLEEDLPHEQARLELETAPREIVGVQLVGTDDVVYGYVDKDLREDKVIAVITISNKRKMPQARRLIVSRKKVWKLYGYEYRSQETGLNTE